MPKTMVMIHGMTGSPWHWYNYKEFFTDRGYHCLTPTLRYHDMDPGDDPDPGLGTTSLLDYAGDLEQEIRKLDQPPIIMGHSMGGLLAQIVGSRVPARALVLLTPAPPRGILMLQPSAIRLFAPVMTRWGFWRQPFRPSFDQAVYGFMHLVPPEEQKMAYELAVYESGLALMEIGLWFLDSKKASRVDYQQIKCPVLIIAGGQDRSVPAAVVRKNAARYRGQATYLEYKNHAHWVLGEPGWEKIAQDIDNWLRKNT